MDGTVGHSHPANTAAADAVEAQPVCVCEEMRMRPGQVLASETVAGR